ncbi:hypothetical protein ACFP1L_12080 [Lactiplantibacillus nangangensis]|uniref:Uncharacterized protein n=1 Tax=Lactiplantibacillus nangangensis TaxID=2559917 RepID=A0ABW1SM28_9LACO|nr:hypothetical protein [Lactiplantibacillus nangangensis]
MPTVTDTLQRQSRIISTAMNNIPVAAYDMPSIVARQNITASNLTTLHVLGVPPIHKQSLINSAMKSVNLQKSLALSVNNALNLQIQNITAYDMSLGTKFNNVSNQLGLKQIEKSNAELANLIKLLGADQMNDVFDTLYHSSSEFEPSKPSKELVESDKENIPIDQVNYDSQNATRKVNQTVKGFTNQIIQRYQSLSESKKFLFNAVIGELVSYVIGVMFNNFGVTGTVIILFLLISPGYNKK